MTGQEAGFDVADFLCSYCFQSATEEFRVVNWRGTKVVARILLSAVTKDPEFL